jgi:hypothetical protein
MHPVGRTLCISGVFHFCTCKVQQLFTAIPEYFFRPFSLEICKPEHGGVLDFLKHLPSHKPQMRLNNMSRIVATLALIGACLLVAAPAKAAQREQGNAAQSVNAVIEWNRTLLAIVRTPGAQPATIHSTRNLAILHAAIYDAINNIDPKFSPYLVRLANVRPRNGAPKEGYLRGALARAEPIVGTHASDNTGRF